VPPVDTQNPDRTVGDGTPGSVTAAAIQAALDQGGRIVLDPGPGGVTVRITTPLRVTRGPTVLDGRGRVTLDGAGASRVLLMEYNVEFTLQNADVVNARVGDRGGGIEGNQGRLAVINCDFTACEATSSGPDIGGGAIYVRNAREVVLAQCTFTNCRGSNGGAVGTLGCDLIVTNCTFTGNRAFGVGGGADRGPSGQGGIGGAIYVDGVHQFGSRDRFELAGCTFVDNAANDHGGTVFLYCYPGSGSEAVIDETLFERSAVSGGLGNGGAVYLQNGRLTLTNSTFSASTTTRQGGGLWLIAEGPASIQNCTFSGNRSTSTGSGLGGGLQLSQGQVSLTNVTVAGNHAEAFGGGIFASSNAQVVVKNLLLASNTATDPFNGHNVNRTLLDGGGNLQWPRARSVGGQDDTPVVAGVTFADPRLEALAQNGGPTPTRALGTNSAAIDAGTSGAPPTDQRGQARNGPPDVGAFER
jgi:hypothetical protein